MWTEPQYEVICSDREARWILHSAFLERTEAIRCAKELERRQVRVRVAAERFNEETGRFRGNVVYETGKAPVFLPVVPKGEMMRTRRAPPPRRPSVLERLVAAFSLAPSPASDGRGLASG
jgi:hypothetical protein